MCAPKDILLLAMVMLSAQAMDPVLDTNKALKVRYTANEHCLSISCDFELTRTSMSEVNKVEMFITPLVGDGVYDLLTAIETSAEGQMLYNSLSEMDLDIAGEIGEGGVTQSHLRLEWKTITSGYCLIYQCMATGVDAAGNEIKLFRPVKVKGRGGETCVVKPSTNEILNNLLGLSYTCSSTVDSAAQGLLQQTVDQVSAEIGGVSMLVTAVEQNRGQVLVLNNEISGFSAISDLRVMNNNRLPGVEQQLDDLNGTLEVNLISRVPEFESRIDPLLDAAILRYKLLRQDTENFYVSEVYEGRFYVLSKNRVESGLESMNTLCNFHGGYLAEMDGGMAEQTFVANFMRNVWISQAFTGGNDVDQETSFEYINSGRPFTNEVWNVNEPSFSGLGASLDCVILEAMSAKLEDADCDLQHNMVCEIPLEC